MRKAELTASFVSPLYSFAERDDRTAADLWFVFTDFQPNANKQGIPRDEVPNIMQTGLHKPVKIAFRNGEWYGHAGATPIGPIVEFVEEDQRLLAKAVLWKHEFPEVYEVLKQNQDDVYFSWELYYSYAEADGSTQWLRGCEVIGSTIVDNPAYEDRTPLIALSSTQEVTNTDDQVGEGQVEDVAVTQLEAPEEGSLQEQERPSATQTSSALANAGMPGSRSDYQHTQRVARYTSAETVDVEALLQELLELRSLKDKLEYKSKWENRLAALASHAPHASSFESFLMSLSDDQFASLLLFVQEIAPKKTASEVSASRIPDPMFLPKTTKTLAEWLREEVKRR